MSTKEEKHQVHIIMINLLIDEYGGEHYNHANPDSTWFAIGARLSKELQRLKKKAKNG